MNDTIAKDHTREYLRLKEVALRLDDIWTKAQAHSPRTIASARRHVNREWDAAVAELIVNGSKPGTINAARLRLERGKNLLSFLDG